MSDTTAAATRFAHLDFDGFRALALDPSLSRHEKVGFPDDYREGREDAIFADVLTKLTGLHKRRGRVLEIGPGCSALPALLVAHTERTASQLTFVDSAEMLALLPDAPHARKVAGRFPHVLRAELPRLAGTFDAIVAYSVLQYEFADGNVHDFVDTCCALLAEGGELLLGDVPNTTMRKRFFASAEGQRIHRQFTGRDDAVPEVTFNRLEPGAIDDSVVLALLARARAAGFHGWVLPQAAALPMANRREDVLIRRP